MYKIGDHIYLKEEYCKLIRVENKLWEIINYKFHKKTYDSNKELSAYTVRYGYGGHDVSLEDIDFIRTDRENKLNEIFYG